MLPRTCHRIGLLCNCKSLSNPNLFKAYKSTDSARSDDNPLPFTDMPEPKSLPLIGTALDYTPIRGFSVQELSEHWIKRHSEHGDIFKEKMPGSSDYWVFCRSKEDTERLFRMEGRMPYRMYLKDVAYIKKILGYPDSIGNEKGESWIRLRLPVNKVMLKKPAMWKYAKAQQEVCKDAVKYILRHRDDKFEVPGLEYFLQAWAFEVAVTFLFNTRIGMLEDNPSKEIQRAFRGPQKMMELLAASIIGGPWKYKEMIGLKRTLLQSQSVMKSILEKQKKAENLDGSFLQDIMAIESLSEIEKESLLMDILLGAVETSANTMALCLYSLAMSKRVQDNLRNEIMELSPDQRSSGRAIDGMVYMNAFFKEAHRLLPFTHGLPRIFDHDLVLSGYRIPAGTHIINTSNSTANKDQEYFENPEECIPERWLEKNAPKFRTTGPFGIGARGCPGRFFAKQEIFLFLTEIISNFEVQYHYEPAKSLMKSTGVLSEKPKFSFVSI